MAKLFNNIRKKLVSEKPSATRTTNYLKYAIGEIVLVVIGILIALQINNANEFRIERGQEQVVLKQLQTAFKSNLKQLNERIYIRKGILYSASQLINAIDNPKKRIKDSIDKYIATSIGYTTFDPIANDFSSSGSLRFIKNNHLKQLLSFWTTEIIQVTENEKTWYDYRNNIYIPFIIKYYQLRTARNGLINSNYLNQFLIDKKENSKLYTSGGIGKTKYPQDFNILLNQPDYEDHLVRCIVTNNIAETQSFTLRKKIVEILAILNNEIKK